MSSTSRMAAYCHSLTHRAGHEAADVVLELRALRPARAVVQRVELGVRAAEHTGHGAGEGRLARAAGAGDQHPLRAAGEGVGRAEERHWPRL